MRGLLNIDLLEIWIILISPHHTHLRIDLLWFHWMQNSIKTQRAIDSSLFRGQRISEIGIQWRIKWFNAISTLSSVRPPPPSPFSSTSLSRHYARRHLNGNRISQNSFVAFNVHELHCGVGVLHWYWHKFHDIKTIFNCAKGHTWTCECLCECVLSSVYAEWVYRPIQTTRSNSDKAHAHDTKNGWSYRSALTTRSIYYYYCCCRSHYIINQCIHIIWKQVLSACWMRGRTNKREQLRHRFIISIRFRHSVGFVIHENWKKMMRRRRKRRRGRVRERDKDEDETEMSMEEYNREHWKWNNKWWQG